MAKPFHLSGLAHAIEGAIDGLAHDSPPSKLLIAQLPIVHGDLVVVEASEAECKDLELPQPLSRSHRVQADGQSPSETCTHTFFSDNYG